MRRSVQFYKTSDGKCPVEDFLDSLPGKVAQRITWVLSLIEELDIVPSQYFKKLHAAENIWECRINHAGNTCRLLGFFYGQQYLILTNGFIKKTQKIPATELLIAFERKKDFLKRGGTL